MTEESQVKQRQLDELKTRREKIWAMGGKERVANQKKRGKLTARERIDTLLDKGTFHEIGMFARSRSSAYEEVPADGVITGYGKINGRKVFIFSQDFTSMGGTLSEIHGKKINIPIFSLNDVPGYLPGTDQEWGGIIRHGAKTLYAYSEATVPKITLTIRKTYGGAYEGIGGKETGTDWVFCWPSTELAVMGPEGATPIIFRKELEGADNPEELLQQKIAEYREQFANPYQAASDLHIDDIIDPAETRPILIRALEALMDKVEERPKKKRGIMPT